MDIDDERSERRLVDLIRAARVDAKIDSSLNLVVTGTNRPSIHQQLIDRTKQAIYRTDQLSRQIEKKYQQMDALAAAGAADEE